MAVIWNQRISYRWLNGKYRRAQHTNGYWVPSLQAAIGTCLGACLSPLAHLLMQPTQGVLGSRVSSYIPFNFRKSKNLLFFPT